MTSLSTLSAETARSPHRASPEAPDQRREATAECPLRGDSQHVYVAVRRDRLALQEQAARLGPIARISLGHIPLYIVTCGDLAHEVLVEHAASFQKSSGIQFLRPLLGDGLLTAEGEPHRQHRKLLAPAFTPRRLASYGAIM